MMARLQIAVFQPFALLCLLLTSGVTDTAFHSLALREESDCDAGLRQGSSDYYILKGTVDADASTRVDYSILITFQAKRIGGGAFSPICYIDITSCVNDSSIPCYCVADNVNSLEILANVTAKNAYGTIEASFLWTNATNSRPPLQSNSVTLPKIYDAGTESISCENQVLDLTSCSFSVDSGKQPQCSCSDAPSPCKAEAIQKNGNYTVSYSVCGVQSSNTTPPVPCTVTFKSDCWCKLDWGLPCGHPCIILIIIFLLGGAGCALGLMAACCPQMICCCYKKDVSEVCGCCKKYRRHCCENLTWCCSCTCYTKPHKKETKKTETQPVNKTPADREPKSKNGDVQLMSMKTSPQGAEDKSISVENENKSKSKRRNSNSRPKGNQVGEAEDNSDDDADSINQSGKKDTLPTVFRPRPQPERKT